MSIKKLDPTTRYLERLAGGPLTFGRLLESTRLSDGLSQTNFAKRLKISCSHLCDIEKGRKVVSAERAARFARILGYSEPLFVKLALQDVLTNAGLELTVEVRAA